MATLRLNVNGRDETVTVDDPGMPLLWALRDLLGLTGTKYGCGIEVCGACTVLVDGQRVLPARLQARGMLVGTTEEVVDQLGRLAEMGVEEVQLQHLDFDSDEGPEFIAAELTPRVASL